MPLNGVATKASKHSTVDATTHGEQACRTKSGGGGAKRGGIRKLSSGAATAADGRTSPARAPVSAIIPGLIGGLPSLQNLAPLALARQTMEEWFGLWR